MAHHNASRETPLSEATRTEHESSLGRDVVRFCVVSIYLLLLAFSLVECANFHHADASVALATGRP